MVAGPTGGAAAGGVGYAAGHKLGGSISKKASRRLDMVEFEGDEGKSKSPKKNRSKQGRD